MALLDCRYKACCNRLHYKTLYERNLQLSRRSDGRIVIYVDRSVIRLAAALPTMPKDCSKAANVYWAHGSRLEIEYSRFILRIEFKISFAASLHLEVELFDWNVVVGG